MIKTKQTVLHNPEAGVDGNCFSAVLASLLHLRIEMVPIFTGPSWRHDVNRWLRKHGLAYIQLRDFETACGDFGISGCHHEIGGTTTRRNDCLHAVVGVDGVPVFDPHPDDTGLAEQLGPRIKLMRGEIKRHTYLTPTQVEHLAECCDHPTVALAIRLSARTGLRQGELLRVDTIHDGHIVIGPEISKTGKPRLVPVPADMSDLVLPIGISYNTLRTYFERARVKADMPALHWHDLRHTAASWWAQSGATLVLLRDLLGHTSFAETSRYSHLVRGDLKAGAERMAERMTVDLSVAQDSHKDT